MAKKQEGVRDRVYKVITVVGVSTENFEAAIQNAVMRAGETLSNLRWFEVKEFRGALGERGVLEYQVVVDVSFEVR